jgi:hypothetical protein
MPGLVADLVDDLARAFGPAYLRRSAKLRARSSSDGTA